MQIPNRPDVTDDRFSDDELRDLLTTVLSLIDPDRDVTRRVESAVHARRTGRA